MACVALVAAPARAQDLKQPTAGKALRTLVKQANKVPAGAASSAQRRKFVSAAVAAKRAWPQRACRSVRELERFRRVLERVRIKRSAQTSRATQKLSVLGPASIAASRALLASRHTKDCGGGVKPSTLEEPKFTVLQSDANGMRVQVELPALRFVEEVGGGQAWTRLELPDTDSPTPPGSPGIPMTTDTFGVPDGATVDVTVNEKSSYTVGSVDVFPTQPEPVDQAESTLLPLPDFHAPPYSAPPFEVDRAAYDRAGAYPAHVAEGAVLGQSRDLVLGNLRVPAARYNPQKKTLEVINSVEVTVNFVGGAHTFSEQLGSPWEQAQRRLAASLLNGGAVRPAGPHGVFERCGEEMLVITNPSTLAAANTFAAARRAAGLRTSVFQTGTGPGFIGATPGEIQAFIRSHLTAEGCIHPSYVTILGDDELVPTFPGIAGIESDLEYSLRDNADEFPDVAVGRIVGDDAAGVSAAVTKIINYETAPPGGDWLSKATIAAEFQDDENPNQAEDRTFILFAERSRTGILTAPGGGLSVDRIYATYPPGAVDPLRYRDGTPLPAELLKPTFAWDGDTADIAAAWNEGRYLVIHRDHGWPGGFDNPRFSADDVSALTNGAMLPVVLSINCSSGAFQDDDRSFSTQALVNPNGGAVGVFGDTEISPTDHNTQLAFGFLDALVPRVLAGEGPDDRLRVGEALIYGKSRLAGIWPPSGPGITGGSDGTRAEFYLWHYFGDPSMQMWGGEPVGIPDLSRFEAVYRTDFDVPPGPDPPPYAVELTLPPEFNGEAVSLIRGGQVIGKAVAADGRALIPAAFGDGAPTQGDLRVAMDADGALPVSVPVDGLPVETKLTTTCPASPQGTAAPMAMSGTLEPSVANAQVVLRYTPPTGQPFERTVTTDGNGNWSDKITPGPNNPGEWHVQARYEGDAAHTAASGQECTVTVM
jgi:hypothetical protein